MTYSVEVCEPGGRWHDLHTRRRYTLTGALGDFWREVTKGTRGVRVMRRETQVAAYWPRAA